MNVTKPQRLLRHAGEFLLTASALLGLLCLSAAALLVAFGLRPLVVQTGSMAPAIPAGSLGVVEPIDPDDIRVGDVVTIANSGVHITHRVVGIQRHSRGSELRLKGDANQAEDPTAYQVEDAEILRASVPYLGTVLSWARHRLGTGVIGAYCALMLMLILRRSNARPSPPAPRSSAHRATRRRRLAPRLLRLAAFVTVLSLVPGRAHAVWLDRVPVAGTQLRTLQVQVQAQSECEPGRTSGTVNVIWPHVAPGYEYVWYLVRQYDGTLENQGVVSPAASVEAGAWVGQNFSTGLLSLGLGNLYYDVIVQARLRAAPSWSAPSTTTTEIYVSRLILGLSMNCA